MPLLILHGDNHLESRRKLQSVIDRYRQAKGSEIIRLTGKNLSQTELIEAFEAQSLFGNKRLVVIDSLHALKSKTGLKSAVAYLATLDPGANASILWEAKKLTATQLKALANFRQEEYAVSPVIFKLVEQIRPGNQRQFLPLFEQACAQDSPEFVFHMLTRQLRLLIQTYDGRLKSSPWQLKRYQTQLKSFSLETLKQVHRQLVDLDWRQKTGRAPLPLKTELERVLLTV